MRIIFIIALLLIGILVGTLVNTDCDCTILRQSTENWEDQECYTYAMEVINGEYMEVEDDNRKLS